MAFCALLALLSLAASSLLPAAPDRGQAILRNQIQFANAHNGWASAIQHLSPHSPDFERRARQEWLEREVSLKFRRLERSLQ